MMTHLFFLKSSVGSAVGNHLWQSTVFCAVVWLVTLALRRNSARVRYGLWLAGSVKFLVPFSLLIALGGLVPRPRPVVVAPAVYTVADAAGLPFSDVPMLPMTTTVRRVSLTERVITALPMALGVVWLCGIVTVLSIWVVRWRRVSATLRRSVLVEQGREVGILRRLDSHQRVRVRLAMASMTSMEPGIFGVWRPVLIWPAGLSERLEDEHIEAILVHELMHVRRRDNLTAALHMVVEAAFWFHPMVWWMERRMVEERERACDEAVVEAGGKPAVYAESLLKTCRFCVESPLACVSGVTGADLNARIVTIMAKRLGGKLSVAKKLLLAGMGMAAVAAPVGLGIVYAAQTHVETKDSTVAPPKLEVLSVRENNTSGDKWTSDLGLTPDGLTGSNVPLEFLIRTAYDVGGQGRIPGMPSWSWTTHYDIAGKVGEADMEKLRGLTGEPQRQMIRAMLREVLADRFKMVVHRETTEMPVYELVVAKGGPKIKPAKPGDPYTDGLKEGPDGKPGGAGKMRQAPGEVVGQALPVSMLAGFLTQKTDRTVVDKTGLTGDYDFEVHWTPDGAPEGDYPPLAVAVQEQLGLRLVATKAPTEIFVIDHVERPAPQDDAGFVEAAPLAAPSPQGAGMPSQPMLRPVALAKTIPAQNGTDKQMVKLPAYDVVTIKPNRLAGVEDYDLDGGLDTFSATGISLKKLLESAYGLRDEQISGIPAGIDSARFDIEAKIVDTDLATLKKLTPKQRNEMLVSVLTERFHLTTHTEIKTLPVYELVVAKGGPKFTQAAAGSESSFRGRQLDSHGRRELWLVIQDEPITSLTEILEDQTHRSVVDKTGLTGNYGFTLKWTREGVAEESTDSYPGILTALQEQLGLKLQSGTGPVKALVIDHAEMPTAN